MDNAGPNIIVYGNRYIGASIFVHEKALVRWATSTSCARILQQLHVAQLFLGASSSCTDACITALDGKTKSEVPSSIKSSLGVMPLVPEITKSERMEQRRCNAFRVVQIPTTA